MRRAAIAALTLAASAGIPATAQTVAPEAAVLTPERTEVTPGATLTARISQSIEADSNYNLDDPSPGTSYYGDTRAALDYLRESPDQTFGLGVDVGVRPLAEAGQDFEVVVASPSTAYLTFGQEGPNTAFNADLNARTRQVDASTADFVDTNGDLIPDTLEQGQRDTREQRLQRGHRLHARHQFAEHLRVPPASPPRSTTPTTPTPTWCRNDTFEGQALWTLAITPVFSAALFGGYTFYTAEDDIDSELNIAEAEAGLVYQPDPNLRIRGGIGYADRHREGDDLTTGERHTIQDDQGVTLRGDVRYVLPSFTAGRQRPLDRGGPDRAADRRAARRLQPAARPGQGPGVPELRRRPRRRRGAGDRRQHRAHPRHQHRLARRARLRLRDPGEPGRSATEPDIDRTDLTLSYGYDFTDAISAEVGYTFRNRVEDPENATSNRFYFVIGRDFVTGL